MPISHFPTTEQRTSKQKKSSGEDSEVTRDGLCAPGKYGGIQASGFCSIEATRMPSGGRITSFFEGVFMWVFVIVIFYSSEILLFKFFVVVILLLKKFQPQPDWMDSICEQQCSRFATDGEWDLGLDFGGISTLKSTSSDL